MDQTTPKPFVFVVMPFDPAFDDIYELGIKAACIDSNTYCERLDEQTFEEMMLTRLYNQISKADLIVADMTGRNANVFYEVGYAHALGKRVIHITQDANDIPFDLKQHSHIIYGGRIGVLKQKLAAKLKWYVENPSARKIEAAESIQFFINGDPITAGSTHVQTLQYKFEEICLPLEIAAFNPVDIRVEEASVSVGLVTPPVFSACTINDPSYDGLQSLCLPSRDYLHQYIGIVTLQPGGWSKIVFPLTTTQVPLEVSTMTGLHTMRLRILSGGQPMETEFMLSVQPADNYPSV